MGLRDFFNNIISKITGKEIKRLPPPKKVIQEDFVPEVEKNAYVEAYTKRINSEKSEFKINEDGTRIKFTDQKTNKPVEVQRMTKIKSGFEYNERNIDLYKAIYAFGNKEDRKIKKIYFALPSEKGILDLYKGSTKRASLKKKLRMMFSPKILESKKVFLGIIIEDEIYNDYSIVQSGKLEEYVVELEKKRQMIKMNKQKSKNQVKQTIDKKDKIKMLKNETKRDKLNIKQSKVTKSKVQNESGTRKTKDIIKSLNTVRTLNEQN